MFVYGPVISRRFGKSLGVSLTPSKTCTYNCVYCQLGRTTKCQIRRESFFPKEVILEQITSTLRNHAVDYVTFAGDGEPTLSCDIGWLIEKTKAQGNVHVAVLTNGSLLGNPEVRDELQSADVVAPNLDASNQKLYQQINRPHASLKHDSLVSSLVGFRNKFPGQLWIEVMLIDGINDSPKTMVKLKSIADTIAPDRIYTLTPIRPPAERWVKSVSYGTMMMAKTILAESVPLHGLDSDMSGLNRSDDIEQTLLDLSSRQPLRRKQAVLLAEKLGASRIVDELLVARKLIQVSYRQEEYLLPSFIASRISAPHKGSHSNENA